MEAPHAAILMEQRKRIALVAHDNKKQDLLEWARYNVETLRPHNLCATGTTGALLCRISRAGDRAVAQRPAGR